MRRPLELLLRLVGVGLLAVALVVMWRRAEPASSTPVVSLTDAALTDSTGRRTVAELSAIIERAASDRAWPRVQLVLHRIPDGAVRRALAASRLAGLPVTWNDTTLARGLAVSASADADPQGGTLLRAQGDPRRPLVVRDGASLLDTVDRAGAGLSVRATRLTGSAEARQGTSRAIVAVPAPAILRRVLLVARPGWEAKFVAAALEERGWQVDGSLLIARRATVNVGTPLALDTARYSAVIVLDSGVVKVDALAKYARTGGGVIVANDALLGNAFASLLPATVTGARPSVPGALLTEQPRLGLDAWTFRPAARAVVLESDMRGNAGDPSVVAWRVGAGRVAMSAYRDTWRWRMQGSDDGTTGHRAWWSALVGAVAFVPAPPTTPATSSNANGARAERTLLPGDAAPYADLVARLGLPSTATIEPALPSRAPARLWLLYIAASVALLAEWWLRRLRGAP